MLRNGWSDGSERAVLSVLYPRLVVLVLDGLEVVAL